MKRRRLLLSPPLLPTITETLEDLPALSTSSQSIQSSQSLEDYMTSIQALARPVEAPSQSVTRFQRSHRTRHFTKGQMKLSASPRTLRTSRPKTKDYSLSGNITDELPLMTDCREKDPIDWLFGQIRTWKPPKSFYEFLTGLCCRTFTFVKGHSNVWLWGKVNIYLFLNLAFSSLDVYMFNIL